MLFSSNLCSHTRKRGPRWEGCLLLMPPPAHYLSGACEVSQVSNRPASIPLDRNFDAPYGECLQVAPRIARLLAPNPGPFTFKGTGVYILGERDVVVVDPGPDIPAHIDALKRALAGKRVTHILITHTHRDHSPAAAALKAFCRAKAYAYGPHRGGDEDAVRVEEGGDWDFVPDVRVKDRDVLECDGFAIECVFTPGHT